MSEPNSLLEDELPDIPTEIDRTEILAKQGSITFAGDVIKKLFGFLIIAVITRLVSPGVYGLFTIAVSLVLFIQTIAGLGLPKAIDYFVPQHLNDDDDATARGVIYTAATIVLVSSTIVAVALVSVRFRIAALFGEPALAFALLLLAVTLPFLAIYNLLLASFNAIKRLKYRVYMRDFVRPTVRLLSTAGLLLAGVGLIGIVAGYVIGLFASVCVGVLLLWWNAPELLRGPVSAASPRSMLSYAAPLAVAGLIYVIMGQIDYFIIGLLGSAEGVGIYRVGYMLAANMLIIFTAVSPVFKPLIAEVRDDDDSVQRQYRTATRWVAGLTLPLALTLSLGAGAYLSLIFTAQYAAASLAVVILATGYLINVTCGGPDGALLQGLGYSRLVFLNTSLLLGTNAVGSALLVPRFGITGAAIGTASALVIAGVAAISEVYLVRGIHPITPSLLKLFLSAVPAALAGLLVVFVLPPIVVAVVLPIVVAVVYAVAVITTGALTDADVAFAAQFGPTAEELVATAADR
ncbi:MAG: flippase [Halobacteriota archaeon]|uniref:flippase n=1 Tax=Natronomonas sp. TaxID=2184060 RepID=UPI0039768949